MTRQSLLSVAAVAIMASAVDVTGQQPVFSARTVAVRLDASVFDGTKVVRGLTTTDFEVSDSGVKQNVQVLETHDAQLDVVLLVQPMRSLTLERQSLVQPAAEALRRDLQPSDRFGLVLASAAPEIVRPLNSADGAAAVVGTLTGSEGVTVRDAMLQSLLLFDAEDRRKALVVLTDGTHDQSWVREGGVQAAADHLNVQVIVGGIETNSSRIVGSTWYDGGFSVTNRSQVAGENRLELPRWLQELARRTGGACVDLRSSTAPERMRELLSYLRSQYVITYTPSRVTPTGWHDVTVRLRGKKGTVVTRAGYWATDQIDP